MNEEPNALKEDTTNNKLAELTDDELTETIGGRAGIHESEYLPDILLKTDASDYRGCTKHHKGFDVAAVAIGPESYDCSGEIS